MKVVALTGAGISISAGIPGFNSISRGIPIREVLTREFANGSPETFKVLMDEITEWAKCEPTKAHKVLAEAQIPIVTQNIDMLHQKGGSKKVFELHGNIRDGIVLFGDEIRYWNESVDLIGEATNLLVIGCSLYAKPAGYLPEMAERNGSKVIFMNTNADQEVTEWVRKNFK